MKTNRSARGKKPRTTGAAETRDEERAALDAQLTRYRRELADAEASMQERLELEALVSELSTQFVHARTTEIDSQIQSALERIAQHLDIDRIALREFDAKAGVARLVHAWFRHGTRDPVAELSLEQVPWAAQMLLDGQVIGFSRASDLPPDSGREQALLRQHGIQSFLAVPLRVGKRLVGVFTLGADRHEHMWPEHHVQWLRIVGEMLASAVARQRAEQRLLASRAQLQALASELTRTEEREKRRIASYLHDHVGQALALLHIKLGRLRRIADPEVCGEQMKDIEALLKATMDDVQTATFELSPPVLHDLGLRAAIGWIAGRLTRKGGLTLEIEDRSTSVPADPDICALLYRAVLELLVNVVRHAQARHVRLEISNDEDWLTISVEDDGAGFDTAILEPHRGKTRFGLFSISERLGYSGGRVEIDSRAGRGTRISLHAPCGR